MGIIKEIVDTGKSGISMTVKNKFSFFGFTD